MPEHDCEEDYELTGKQIGTSDGGGSYLYAEAKCCECGKTLYEKYD